LHLERSGHDPALLRKLKDKIMSLIPRARAARIETDHDALLEAQGFVARPGPRPRVDAAAAAIIAEAIKACRHVEFLYKSQRDEEARSRCVAPYGLLSGMRRYLVGRPKDEPEGPIRSYRMDVIRNVTLSDDSFVRPTDFDLHAFSNSAFGAYERSDEYGEVIWRFVPEAAEHARGYLFHPDQTMEEQQDGSLIVRFMASGHLEMCWHLYAWGNKVEVLAPRLLKEMVEGFQRSDFPAMP
jgi:predicted DNA-binding transcriptional regulator YafY